VEEIIVRIVYNMHLLRYITGEQLMQRKDDTPNALKKRLASYHNETVPILKHYEPNGIVKAVNANQGMDGVWTEILAVMKRRSA